MLRLKNRHGIKEITQILAGFVILMVISMIAQDYFATLLFKTTYVLQESLLFKTTIIIFFIPIVIYNSYTEKKIYKEINISKLLAYLIPITIVHIFISGLFIAFISQNFLDSSFSFLYLIKNKFANDFIFIFTVYGLMYLIARYYFQNIQNRVVNKDRLLTIKMGTKTKIVNAADIDWISAETPYIGIWLSGQKHLQRSTLSNILTDLDNKQFVRIHRSTIVNTSQIQNIKSRANGDYDIQLFDKTILRMSRNYRNNLKHSQLKF